MKSKSKILHQLKAKGNNKRILIQIIEFEDKSHSIAVFTKTLIDFKSRNILKTSNLYSVETFKIINDMFSYILDSPEIKNKLFLQEIDQIKKFRVETSI